LQSASICDTEPHALILPSGFAVVAFVVAGGCSLLGATVVFAAVAACVSAFAVLAFVLIVVFTGFALVVAQARCPTESSAKIGVPARLYRSLR
jgi:hypothetical protein